MVSSPKKFHLGSFQETESGKGHVDFLLGVKMGDVGLSEVRWTSCLPSPEMLATCTSRYYANISLLTAV
jgi:hypothetical protein